MKVLDWMRPPSPTGGPPQTYHTLTDYRGATSSKLTLLAVLLPCTNSKVFRENRCQQQVGRVGPGQVPSTLGPHHPSSSNRPYVISCHLLRLLTTILHDLAQLMRVQSPNTKAPLSGNTDLLCTSIIIWAHRQVSGCRTQV